MNNTGRRRILVFSYSNISKDSRVLRQIRWLVDSRFAVDGVGLGKKPNGIDRFYEINPPPLWQRILIYLLSTPNVRSNRLLETITNSDLFQRVRNGEYHRIVLNDLDFLALDGLFDAASNSKTQIILDLHEYFPDVGGSLIYRALHGRYHAYLQLKIQERDLYGFITVSPDIAALYHKNFGRVFTSVENIPDGADTEHISGRGETPRMSLTDAQTQIVYHGNSGKGRGLYHLILAMRWMKNNVRLNLVLTGSDLRVRFLKLFAQLSGTSSKVFFWPAVTPERVTSFLCRFDLAIIFFPPPHTTSISLSLPNKFFEALSAGMGVIVGPNPTMSRIVNQYNCGFVLENWRTRSLAEQLSLGFDRESIQTWRNNGALVLQDYSADKAKSKFLSVVL